MEEGKEGKRVGGGREGGRKPQLTLVSEMDLTVSNPLQKAKKQIKFFTQKRK